MIIKERLDFTRSLTIWEEQKKSNEVIIELPETQKILRIPIQKRPYQTYTAGPLFTFLQRRMIEGIATIVASKGVIPWSPHVMHYYYRNVEIPSTVEELKEAGFKRDVRGIDTSDFLIMWADYGFEPDPGTVWEQSRAYMQNKPIIALREDRRNICSYREGVLRESVMNLMMEQSTDIVARNLDELGEAIVEVIKFLDDKQSKM